MKKRAFRVVWSGKTARECSTSTMACIDEDHWGSFHFVTLHIVDMSLLRIVHTIDVPIDEVEGWAPDDALERISTMRKELETLLQKHAHAFESCTMGWDDIQI